MITERKTRALQNLNVRVDPFKRVLGRTYWRVYMRVSCDRLQ